MKWIRWFEALGIEDVPSVGGKNASLGRWSASSPAWGFAFPMGSR